MAYLTHDDHVALKRRMDEGDESARTILFEQMHNLACRVALTFQKRKRLDADDLMSEASMVLWERLGEWNPEHRPLIVFVRSIVNFHIINRTKEIGHLIRTAARCTPLTVVSLDAMEGMDVQDCHEEPSSTCLTSSLLRQILKRLCPDPVQQRVFDMRWRRGYFKKERSIPEIAAAVGWTADEVNRLLRSMRQRIGAFIRKAGEGERINVCVHCKDLFLHQRYDQRRYCSEICEDVHKFVKANCERCHEPFLKLRSSKRFYCSDECGKIRPIKVFGYRKCALPNCDKSIEVHRLSTCQFYCCPEHNDQHAALLFVPPGSERQCGNPACKNRFVVSSRCIDRRFCKSSCFQEYRKATLGSYETKIKRRCKRPACKAAFEVAPMKKRQKYCCKNCHRQHTIESRPKFVCHNPSCGRRFYPKDGPRSRKPPQFCSRNCMIEGQKARRAARSTTTREAC